MRGSEVERNLWRLWTQAPRRRRTRSQQLNITYGRPSAVRRADELCFWLISGCLPLRHLRQEAQDPEATAVIVGELYWDSPTRPVAFSDLLRGARRVLSKRRACRGDSAFRLWIYPYSTSSMMLYASRRAHITSCTSCQ